MLVIGSTISFRKNGMGCKTISQIYVNSEHCNYNLYTFLKIQTLHIFLNSSWKSLKNVFPLSNFETKKPIAYKVFFRYIFRISFSTHKARQGCIYICPQWQILWNHKRRVTNGPNLNIREICVRLESNRERSAR